MAAESMGSSPTAASAPSFPALPRSSRPRKRTSFVLDLDEPLSDNSPLNQWSTLNDSMLNKSISETSTSIRAAAFSPKPDSTVKKPEPTNGSHVDSSSFVQSEERGHTTHQRQQQQRQRETLHRAYSCCALGNSMDHEGHADSAREGCGGSVAAAQSEASEVAQFETMGACVSQSDGKAIRKDYVVVRGIKRVKSAPSIVVIGDDGAGGAGGRDESEMQSVHLENHILVAEEAASSDRQTSAVISVDGSNGSADATASAAESVPSTPAFAVPPHPDSCPADMDPDTFIRSTVHAYLGYQPCIKSALALPPTYFRPVTDEDMASYATDVVSAVRENDLPAIKSLHSSGRTLACCNRFGESLIHMACRRGYTEAVSYLLNDADVGVRVRDDCGRTPLHDACWNRECKYEIVDMLIRRDPALLLISDKRGHTPFMYARREHWGVWRQFLFDRTSWIVAGMVQKDSREIFSDQG